MTRRLLLPLLALFLLAWPGIALADPPQRVDTDIVDRAGALAGGTAQVRTALDALRTETGLRLYVVFVRSFDGADGQQWADESARRSQLSSRDVLFAVAVDDRAYGLSVDEGLSVDDRAIDDLLRRDVEPRLGVGDWTGAVVALAGGLARGGSAGGADGGGATPWIVGGAIALAGGAYVLHRRRRTRAGRPGEPDPTAAPDEHPGVSTEDLGFRASSALLELDDAVRTSEQELDLARGQFGEEAVAGFRAALETSRADLVRAFEVRQQLDDDVPEDEPTTRAMLADILRTCAAADARLDAQADDFDRLRDLERTAPEVVARLLPAVDAVQARVPAAEQQLAGLRAGYAASALGTVPDDVLRAVGLLGTARTEAAEAQAELAAGSRGAAVVSARAAEDATAQAGTLLGGVARLADELAQAGARIADTRAEVEADLAEGRAVAGSTAGAAELRAAVARAEAAIAAADRDLAAALPDPLAALRRLTEAAGHLDAALAAAREQRVRDERARSALDGALLAARSAVAAASDFVATRRGAVGSEARTRLAEAQRQLDLATGQAATDPVAALAAAQRADALAREAQQRAEADVARWSAPPGQGPGGGTGVDLGSLVLGGILFGNGHRHGGGHGGFGRGGGFSPGSFGGSATRGRRGTGGRF